MKKLWIVLLLSAIVTLMFKDPSLAVTAMIKGSHDAVKLSMSLVALYAFWLGFFAILERTGIAAKLAKLLTPLVRFLFPSAATETNKFITMNISANLLGLGNAATPMAISAINSMEAEHNGRASINMIMLMVISSTSLQLLPTTVIGLRASHGSSNPADFLLPCMAATLTSTIIGITLVKLYALIRNRRKKHSITGTDTSAKRVSTIPQIQKQKKSLLKFNNKQHPTKSDALKNLNPLNSNAFNESHSLRKTNFKNITPDTTLQTKRRNEQ